MIIAVDTRQIPEPPEKSLAVKLLKQIVSQTPQPELILFNEEKQDRISSFFPGSHSFATGRKTNNRLSLSYRYRVTIPALLKKSRADIFLSFAAIPASSNVPQFFLIDDFYFSAGKNSSPAAFGRRINKMIKSGGSLVTTSSYVKEMLCGSLNVPERNVFLINPVPSAFSQSNDEKTSEGIKSTFTDNKEFFLCRVSFAGNDFFVDILKAFSLFKKRQQSSFKIVFLSDETMSNTIQKKLGTYKYRNDVLWMQNAGDETTANLIASAYACILSEFTYDFTGILTGMLHSGIPLICPVDPVGKLNNCIMVSRPEDHAQMAEAMGMIYKDETYRKSMIENGKGKAKEFSPQAGTEKLWQYIREAVK